MNLSLRGSMRSGRDSGKVDAPMARRILALLLLAMAAGQLSNVTGFVDVLQTYEVGGRQVAWLLAVSAISAEAFSGVGLLRREGSARRLAPTVAVAVALGWTILGVQAFGRGLVLDNCGCFGVHLAQPLRWWILLEDAELIALAWWVRRRSASGEGRGIVTTARRESPGELLEAGQ